jgi:multidrug efflux pump subunit AcrA (membrane-fusion protein)
MKIDLRVLLIGTLAGGLLISGCSASSTAPAATPPAHPPVPVTAQHVQRGDIQQIQTFSGDVKSTAQISVLPQVAGRVEKLLIDVGSHVAAGEVVAQLDSASAQIQVLQARANLSSAQARLAQQQAQGKVDDIAAAEAALKQAT